MTNRIFFVIMITCLFLFLLSSCKKTNNHHLKETQRPERLSVIEENERATDKLLESCITFVDPDEPIIITSLVSIDNLNLSSTMGRMSSEMIANRLTQHGYRVKEIKLGDSVFISNTQGELVLSRELRNIAEEHEHQGFIVGTYAINDASLRKEVFISLRFVDVNNIIGCSHNYSIRNTNIDMWKY